MTTIIIFSIMLLIFGFISGHFIAVNKKQFLSKKQINLAINKILTKYKKNNNNENNNIVLLLINIDDFHSVVSTYGYDFGSNIIDYTKQNIASYSKENKAIFYYVGLDEYAVLYCNKFFNDTQIINEATNLLEIISRPIVQDNHNIHITASVGVSIFPDYADNSDRFLRCAELALVDAKNSGRNTYSFYRQGVFDKSVDRAMIKTELLAALNNDELQLYWHPQVDAHTNVLVGAEVLIRWNHVIRGAVSPEVFISIAEQTGLIWQIGVWIIKHACIQGKFISQELGLTDFRVAINLSSGQFLQGDVVQVIANTIYETGIKPENIEVELTESMFMANAEKCLLMISVLTSMGIKIAIDDFGTGYSSFARLRQLKWHYLKIDQSFIKHIDTDQKNYAIVCAMIAMAKSLNIKVIAEGVETEKELEILQKINCDIIQGYYTSKPLPINEFVDFARNHKVK